jgi:hypothetical protein
MNNTMLKLCRQTLVACAAVALLAPITAKADSFDNDFWWLADPIEGLWNAKVTITNCATGLPLPVSFEAMGLFGRGGSFNNTDAQNPLMPTLRSSSFGEWKRVHARTYQFAFKAFRFDASGTFIGTQVVRHTLTLAKDGKSYASAGTSQAYDVAGNPLTGPPTGCSISTATRFE